jgi:RNA 3'-terminal phosphate cyclase
VSTSRKCSRPSAAAASPPSRSPPTPATRWRDLAAGVPVGDCLADQLLLPLALAGGGSYTTLALTRHAATNIEVIRKFLDVTVNTGDVGHDMTTIEVRRGMV